MVLSALIVIFSLALDRIVGDPHSSFHPVAMLGRFIGWWGQPAHYSSFAQRGVGILLWCTTVALFSLPFFLFEHLVPWYVLLIGGPILLKATFAWRSIEDHVHAVTQALEGGIDAGRVQVHMLVSRDTTSLSKEQILSAAYESAAENLVDSIIAPLFYFGIGEIFGVGLAFAAAYRAANTMDAMLGYRDDRSRLGWWSARADDLLGFIPARVAGAMLLGYFALHGRLKEAYRSLRLDARKRPGVNGGVPLSLVAGGVGVIFEKPGVYRMGYPCQSVEAGGKKVLHAVGGATMIFAVFLVATLCLLRPVTYI